MKAHEKQKNKIVKKFLDYARRSNVDTTSKSGLINGMLSYFGDENADLCLSSAQIYSGFIITHFYDLYDYYIEPPMKRRYIKRLSAVLRNNRANPILDKETLTNSEVFEIYDFLRSKIKEAEHQRWSSSMYDRLLLAFTLGLFCGGRRKSEIINARVCDFSFNRRYRSIDNLLIWDLGQTKTHTYADSPIVRVDQDEGNLKTIFHDYIRKYDLEGEDYLFFSLYAVKYDKRKRESLTGFSNRMDNFFLDRGFSKHYTSRSLRKTYISIMRQHGFSDSQIAIHTLHKKLSSLESYDKRIPLNLTGKVWGKLKDEKIEDNVIQINFSKAAEL